MTSHLRWEDGVPVSNEYDDPYYSKADGLAETRYVYLDGCGLPDRWSGRDSFVIGELGFGTGLNFCTVWNAWEATRSPEDEGILMFRSFEMHPLEAETMNRALSAWPEIDSQRQRLIDAWTPKGGLFRFGNVMLSVMVGDARETVPRWDSNADAWFLDGFAPARNPAMWDPKLLNWIGSSSAPDCHVATYTVAGFVRRGLANAGFAVEKRPGFGTKREMLTGRLKNCD